MPVTRYSFPEFDLTLLVARGSPTSRDVIQAFQALDASCATRWLKYLGPAADMSGIDLASMPALRRVKHEKRRELFGDQPKPSAVVCESKPAEQFFDEFWQRYADLGEHCFRSLDAAYDWLGLSEAARAAVARAIDGGEADAGAHWTGRDPAAFEPSGDRAARP